MTAPADSDTLGDVIAAYLGSVDDGTPPDRAELLARRPELGPELRRFFEAHDQLEQLARPLRDAVQAAALAEAETLDPEDAAAGPPPALPGFEGMTEIGRGGMGVVYLARQQSLDRRVALKRIGREAARGLREAQVQARLDKHPHIVRIHDVLEHDGQTYLCLEYLEGGNLQEEGNGRPLSNLRAAEVLEPLARAMHYAHEQGIIHRDLKPSNVLFTGDRVPKITDFGLARQLETVGLTSSGVIRGTPQYLAPEQAANCKDVGPAADVYGLGGVLYYMLTGRPPRDGTSVPDVIEKAPREAPEPPRSINPAADAQLECICLKCLQKAPADRYRNAGELADAAAAVLARLRGAPLPPTVEYVPSRRSPRRHAFAAMAAAVVLLAVIAAVAYLLMRGGPTVAAARTLQTPRDVLTVIAADLRQTPQADRPWLRYLTLAHLHNNPNVSDAELAALRRTLEETGRRFNVASGRIPVFQPIGADATLYAVDLRRLGWDGAAWRRLTAQYPYGLTYEDSDDADLRATDAEVQRLAGGRLRYVRADWFLQALVNLPVDGDDNPPVPPGQWPEAAATLARQYPEQLLTLDEAATELGLAPAERLREAAADVAEKPALKGMAPLLNGGAVRRAAWESREYESSPFQRLSQRFRLGAPIQ